MSSEPDSINGKSIARSLVANHVFFVGGERRICSPEKGVASRHAELPLVGTEGGGSTMVIMQ